MQCVEQGELDLDAPVHRYLSDVPSESPLAQGISLRHLMSHRSGLVRESPIGNYFDPTEPSLVQTVASLHRTKLTYPIHTKTKYSNAGIAVVGAVLQEKKKKPFHELIQETIFQPLGMNQSSFIRTASVDAHLSKAWMWTYDGRRFLAPEFLLGTGPAGNMYSSVEDLAKFMKFLTSATSPAGKEVLSKSTLKKMMDPVIDADGKPQGFGIGFRVSQLDKHRKIGHGGAVYGFSTQLEVLPDEQLGVAICASLDGCNAAMERLALYALRLALADRSGNALPEYAQTGLIEKNRLREMVGNYSNESNERLSIQEFQGKAYLHNGAFRRELRSESKTGETITDDPNGFGTVLRWPHPDQLEMEKPGQPLQKWKRLPLSVPQWFAPIGKG